jgi:hypothetical protein
MTAGRLAAAKPAATTNTTLYRCPIDKAASVVLNVCNQSASSATYRAAIRDYDQILTLDSASYSFVKGNVISDYTIVISPGISVDQVDPGDEIVVGTNKARFKYHDILKPTSTITYPTKVESIGQINITDTTQVGTFDVGDTITGSVTGLQATLYRVNAANFFLNIPAISSSATSARINNNSGVLANDYIASGGEIMRISAITGYQITLTRAQFGTTAVSISAGTPSTIFRSTGNTTTVAEGAQFESTDLILTVASAASITVGNYLSIGNEFMVVQGINGNDITVGRGQLGSSAAAHANGATVTIYSLVGNPLFNFFQLTEQVDNGSGATVNLNVSIGSGGGSPFQPGNKFVYDLGSGSYEFPASIPVDANRIVRFTQSDSSNTGHPLRFSITPDGTHGGGVEFTTGVTKVGTAGTSGAYSEIDLSTSNIGSNSSIYLYCAVHAQMTNNGFLQVDLSPNYTNVYLYDLQGTLASNDSFTVNNVTYTITSVSAGAYGYVQDKTGTALKISLGANSQSFVATDTFYDSPRVPGTDRTLATVSSVSTINVEDYIVYDKTIAANSIDKNTGVVVGPGQSLMVYSSAADLSYSANGFEDSTSDYVVVYYQRQPGS